MTDIVERQLTPSECEAIDAERAQAWGKMRQEIARFAPPVLDLGSDIGLRQQYFTRESFAHPAKLHLRFLEFLIHRYTRPGDIIADPMAGIGSVLLAAALGRNVIAREIEPRWLEVMKENAKRVRLSSLWAGAINIGPGDARQPWGYECDHVIFSPPYGLGFGSGQHARKGYLSLRLRKAVEAGTKYSRLWEQAANGEAMGSDGSLRLIYGQTEGQIGHLRGPKYWSEMCQVYQQAQISLRSGGYMIIIVKDHIKDGQRQHVTRDTAALCKELGFLYIAEHKRRVHPLSLWQRRRKERGQPVIEEESALVFQLGEKP